MEHFNCWNAGKCSCFSAILLLKCCSFSWIAGVFLPHQFCLIYQSSSVPFQPAEAGERINFWIKTKNPGHTTTAWQKKRKERKRRRVRSTVSCATLFCCEDQRRADGFVDVPWQQTTVGLFLPAGKLQTAPLWTPTVPVQTAPTPRTRVNPPSSRAFIWALCVSNGLRLLILSTYSYTFKAHMIYYSIKYSQPALNKAKKYSTCKILLYSDRKVH